MKLCVFQPIGESSNRLGLLSRDLQAVKAVNRQCDELGWGNASLLDEVKTESDLALTGETWASDAVRFKAPVPRPRRNIFCVGKNYHEHAREFSSSGFDGSGSVVPRQPIIFSKVPETVVSPGDGIRIDDAFSSAVDYEAELAVIIGKGGHAISRAAAMEHVWGYTILNDVTARDVQARHAQWLLGKSADSFCPMGPWIVTADEVGSRSMDIRCWVNGELRQNANTAQLIFDVPTLIETISAGTTLYPGDVIATGTPAGVGIGFNPPRYLVEGDLVKIEITGIGTLENPVVNTPRAAKSILA